MNVSVAKAKEWLRCALLEVVAHRWLILKLLLLASAVLAPFAVRFPDGAMPSFGKFYIFLAVGLCLIGIASRFAFILICLLLLVPALVHQHLDRHWGKGQLGARFEAFFESPPGEIRQYLDNHVDLVDIGFLVGAIVYLAFLIYLAVRPGNQSRLLGRLAGIAAIGWLLIFAAYRLDRGMPRFPPYVVAAQAIEAKARYDELSERAEFLELNPLVGGKCRSAYDKVVIVIGESAISDHMSIFGYGKRTTPFADRSGPHAFDALAPSNQTRYSLGMMLTDARPGAFDVFYKAHSLVGQLRMCGFHTLWVSNQGRRGKYDSFSTSLANEADEQLFLNEMSWHETRLDGQIIDELDARGIFSKTGHATFIHLIGSHTDYGERYPKGFGFPDDSSIVSQYDNSILYTDHVLSVLFEKFSGGPLLFVYVSDHGQMVSESRFGSGFLPGYKEEYRTPLLIWTEDQDSIGALRNAIGDSRLNLSSFDDIIRYLAGLSAKLEVSTQSTVSVLSPEHVRDYRELGTLSEK